MKIHILDLDNYSERALGIYEEIGGVVGIEEEFRSDVDILITRFCRIEKGFIDSFPNLKIIGTSTTGLDHIDVPYAESKGIKVISLNDVIKKAGIISSTGEHTIGLILALARRYDLILQGERPQGIEIQGKILGILGLGRIGSMVEKYGEVFGMKILTYSLNIQLVAFFDLFRSADFLTIHIPLKGNEDLITKEMIDRMKPTAYLINTSRGGVLAQGVLEYACEKLAGVAVDVVRPGEEGFKHPNLIHTPHIGGYTHEGRDKSEYLIALAIKSEVDKSLLT